MRILIYNSCELSSELMMTRRLFVGLGELLVPTFTVQLKESHYEMTIVVENVFIKKIIDGGQIIR